MAAPPSDSLEAEYQAAVTAYKSHVDFMNPTRQEYDALFVKHKSTQAQFDMLVEKMKSHRTTYQRHKQYVVSLSNAMLASNNALRSAPMSISDAQALTHATLLHKFRLAADTMTNIMFQDKRLEKAKNISFAHDQELYKRCHELFKKVDGDCYELDRLHANVLEVGERMGKKPGCGVLDRKCVSCSRRKEREARRAAVAAAAKEAQEMAAKERKGGSRSGKKGLKVQPTLEDILEEVE